MSGATLPSSQHPDSITDGTKQTLASRHVPDACMTQYNGDVARDKAVLGIREKQACSRTRGIWIESHPRRLHGAEISSSIDVTVTDSMFDANRSVTVCMYLAAWRNR